jgi:radical S-adenosyl methionine domain-containing protein 2
LESTSVVTNGSKVTYKWFEKYGRYLDIMALSCDSFDPDTLLKIGRSETGKPTHIPNLLKYVVLLPLCSRFVHQANWRAQVVDWCREYGVIVKANSFICAYNWQEDMSDFISQLNPKRWKATSVFPPHNLLKHQTPLLCLNESPQIGLPNPSTRL